MDITVEKCLNLLPVRYHDEFIGDVLVDKESVKSLNKVFQYYLQDIFPELTSSEKEKIREEYMIIKIYSLQDNSCKLTPTKEIQQEYRIIKKDY